MSSNIQIEYNRAKINLIKKYLKPSKNLSRVSLNADTFISINDFLAEEHSLGPNADPGDIKYYYTETNNISLFLKYLMKDIRFNKIICEPYNVYINYGSIFYKNTILYYVQTDTMYIPSNLSDEIIKCANTNRFNFIYIGIRWENMISGHANILLIDHLKKTIERFEPHGKNTNWENQLDNKFNFKVLQYLNLEEYKYISPKIYEPRFGVQAKSDVYGGMCFTYIIIYLQLRIMNPDIDRKLIIKYLLSKSKQEMIDIILKYAKYIENTLKNNSNDVKKTIKLYKTEAFKIKYNYMLVNYKNEFIFYDHLN